MLFNVIGYSNQILGQVEAGNPIEAWTKAGEKFGNILDVRRIGKFIMYHATPIKNLESVKQTGILRSIPKLPRTRWSPTKPTVYFADDVGHVIDYAEQTYEYYEMTDPKWAIFKIEYDEFPTEPHADLEWGLPGVYWVDNIDIPPEHVTLFGVFDVELHEWINVPVNPCSFGK